MAPSTMSRVFLAAVVLVGCMLAVHADTYMHMMRGGNNRLNEPGFERNNGARLWDSQNNNRGGYNVGSMHRPYYFEGSILPIEWTQQHMCGDVNGNNCEMILQYTCGDELTRDGTTTNTIPIDPKQCTTAPNGDCDQMTQYGRHESVASYQACRYRTRNMGLFTSNQYLRNNQIGGPGLSARFTRQNNNGGRSGLECPEERDYYPYWHPTIWRDIAVLTNKVSRCEAFRAESQNVLDRYYCQWDVNDPTFQKLNAKNIEGMVPITQAECERPPAGMVGGVWTRVPAWGIDPPDCRQNAYTRDNHLGNAMPVDPTKSDTRGYTNMYNWTLPSIEGEINTAYCVLRLRYNISTGEYPFQGYQSDSDVDPGENGLTSAYNLVPVDGQTQVDQNARVPDQFPIWADYRMTKDENAGSWTTTVQNADPNDNNNGGRLGGIRKSLPPSRDYTLRNNPQVDIFGSLLPKNVSAVDGYNGQPMIRVRLAINTAQYGRVFQDRSHVFEIRRRPRNMRGYAIFNLSVRGKKGNIVQTYPGVEYDFTPDRLFVNQGDFVHIQWTGSTPSDGTADGNGANGDRHNLVMLNNRQYVEVGQDPTTPPQNLNPPIVGQLGTAYPGLINDTTQYPPFLGLDWQRLRMLALFGLNSSTFDLGPVQATVAGEYRYMCTRNNAFSNRSQKGTIVVHPNPAWQALGEDGIVSAPMPVSLYGWTQSESGKAKLIQPDWDGSAVIPGSVNVAETDEDDWFVVNPPLMDIGVPTQTLYFEATRPQPSNLFMKGTMMWKLNQNDSAVELIPISGFYDSKNKYMVQVGGFYKSTSTVNSAMVAGITLGCVAAIALIVFLYWKVRVQPHGGWKAFYAKMRAGKGAAGKEQKTELLGTGPELVSSSSPQVAPASPATSA